MVDEIHFTGAFQHLFPPTREEREGHAARRAVVSHKKRSKAEVVHQTQALFLVDDSAENAVDASRADPPVHVLLFGEYPWNAIVPRKDRPADDPLADPEDDRMTYKDKERLGLLAKSEERRRRLIEEGWVPKGVERVKDWDAVVRWVEAKEQDGWAGVAQDHL